MGVAYARVSQAELWCLPVRLLS